MSNDQTKNHHEITVVTQRLGRDFTPCERIEPWFDLAASIVPRGSLAYDLAWAFAHVMIKPPQVLAALVDLRDARPKGINVEASELRAALEVLRAHELVDFDRGNVVFLRWPTTHSLYLAEPAGAA